MVTGTTPGELDRANGGNFASGKLRILGLEIDDQLAHRDRERAMMILSLGFGRAKEADHPMGIKSGSSPA